MIEHPHHAAETAAPWQHSLPPTLCALGLLALYLLAARWQYRRRRTWSAWRILSFSCGTLLLAAAFYPSLVDYAHRDLRGHMIQHLLIGMFAPLGLVLGAPLTLAYRAFPRSPVLVVTRALRSQLVHWISHPLVALVLNIGGMFALYTTPLYQASMENALLHWLIHIHFLLAGSLFIWSVAGPDPAPRRPDMGVRFVALFLSAAAHAYLSKLMYIHHWPQGATRDTTEVEAAAKLMYYGGDLAELLLAVAFFATWYRRRSRQKSRSSLRPHPAGLSVLR